MKCEQQPATAHQRILINLRNWIPFTPNIVQLWHKHTLSSFYCMSSSSSRQRGCSYKDRSSIANPSIMRNGFRWKRINRKFAMHEIRWGLTLINNVVHNWNFHFFQCAMRCVQVHRISNKTCARSLFGWLVRFVRLPSLDPQFHSDRLLSYASQWQSTFETVIPK